MDEIEYRTRLAVIRTAIGPEEYFEDFMERGVKRAKEIITSLLKENSSGLSYGELELLVGKELESVNIRSWTDAWKLDAFMLALAGLELEEKKINERKGIYFLSE